MHRNVAFVPHDSYIPSGISRPCSPLGHESRDRFSRKTHQTFAMRELTTRGKNQRKCESTDKIFANSALRVFSRCRLSESYGLNFPWISRNSSCRRISASSCTGLSSGRVSSMLALISHASSVGWINGQIDRSFIQNLRSFSRLHEESGEKVRMNAVTARAKVENILEDDFVRKTHCVIWITRRFHSVSSDRIPFRPDRCFRKSALLRWFMSFYGSCWNGSTYPLSSRNRE